MPTVMDPPAGMRVGAIEFIPESDGPEGQVLSNAAETVVRHWQLLEHESWLVTTADEASTYRHLPAKAHYIAKVQHISRRRGMPREFPLNDE